MAKRFESAELVYDWNTQDPLPRPAQVEVSDETLRDGLQSPSISDPPIEIKLQALHHMAELGISAANIGMPCTGARPKQDALRLAQEIVKAKLPLRPNCAARTVVSDVQAIVDISQASGLAIEASTFIGSSPIRRLTEGWDFETMLRHTEETISFAVNHQLPVMYVTEDTTRAQPETLRRLYQVALDNGAYRLCIADTVGHITPHGVHQLVGFFREEIVRDRSDLRLDWHGHNDRGLALANGLAALEAGVDCVHGTILGIGERVGNTSLDQLLVNLKLLGWIESELSSLKTYCRLVSEYCNGPLPFNYPVMGQDAFRTSTGVHAAAIIKAKALGQAYLADRVYSGVPAELVGRRQRIEIGPMSGRSNVIYWLESRAIPAEPGLVERLFDRAKRARAVLSEAEIEELIAEYRRATGD
ncbi:MAG TPA: 2-isopropylmalate synthase [Candidatus Fraserbacteria bacterium]|nr:2-isopropylmalate synthase [Candidatus Fraserbacteria bacterium]